MTIYRYIFMIEFQSIKEVVKIARSKNGNRIERDIYLDRNLSQFAIVIIYLDILQCNIFCRYSKAIQEKTPYNHNPLYID